MALAELDHRLLGGFLVRVLAQSANHQPNVTLMNFAPEPLRERHRKHRLPADH